MTVLVERTGAAIFVGLAVAFAAVVAPLVTAAGGRVPFFVVFLVGFVDFMFSSIFIGSILPGRQTPNNDATRIERKRIRPSKELSPRHGVLLPG